MAIIFGIRERGIIKTYKKQYITTQLSYAIIPLKYEKSLLTTFKKDKILNIKTNKLSILISVLRGIYSIFFGFCILLFFSLLVNKELNFKAISFFTINLFLFIYINFILGKSTKKENKIRELLLQETGFSLLPNWIDINDYRTKNILDNLKVKFDDNFPNRKYSEINIFPNDPKFSYFFSLIVFENIFNNNKEINDIYTKLLDRIK